ncbi:hypothetical protein Lal_00001957 [Lupinus albus]|nr:hypothetical protein Lal_00001957 [Lupinus albus]
MSKAWIGFLRLQLPLDLHKEEETTKGKRSGQSSYGGGSFYTILDEVYIYALLEYISVKDNDILLLFRHFRHYAYPNRLPSKNLFSKVSHLMFCICMVY